MTELAYRKLEAKEVVSLLSEVPAWHVEGELLVRRFDFKAYKDGLAFAMAVGHLADRLDHHPDIEIGYRKVRVAMNTHSVGDLSPYDFELARQIDAIA
jgi:4a-hydroxytetrahydrobiopterin dehydratase